MNITTTFSCGDLVWVWNGSAQRARVGQVRVQVTDSEGDPDSMFDNRKPQSGREESYMVDESGIGSGCVYSLGKDIFATLEECESANANEIEKKRIAAERFLKEEHERLLRDRDCIDRQLARLAAAAG